MKTRIATIAIVIIMMMQFTTAQNSKKIISQEKKIEFITKNLLVGLHSTNPGVVQSAIRVTAQMKMRYPSANMSKLMTALNSIWRNNPSGAMRYKAYIAMSICEKPEWYGYVDNETPSNEDSFFITTSAQMREHLLSDNN